MRYSYLWPLLLFLALLLTPVCGADSVNPPPTTWWQDAILALLGLATTVVTAMLVPYLRSKAAAANALAADTAMTTRQRVVERLKSYLWGQAALIVERDFPVIAKEILAGKLKTQEQIKGVLRGLGDNLKNDAIAYFKTQGVDLIETFGAQFIDDMIRRAADSVSPFPGKETAVEFLSDGAKNLLEQGVYSIKYADAPIPLVTPPSTSVAPSSATLKPIGS